MFALAELSTVSSTHDTFPVEDCEINVPLMYDEEAVEVTSGATGGCVGNTFV